MLAPSTLPFRYRWFNLKWGAPKGRLVRGFLSREQRATPIGSKLAGCFAFQGNNTTRRFEYPWAFEALQVRPGLRVLEIGGSLSGFQFVLDHAGCKVTNVDPGSDFHASGWPVTPETMSRFNRLLGTDVSLRNVYLEDAKFPDSSFDRIVSISVFEHIPEPVLAGILAEVRRILKPGGLCVLTVDLFFNVAPFAEPIENEYGHNVSVKWLVESSGLEMIHGEPSQLFGYPEFDWRKIQADGHRFLRGKYPSMIQTVILRKIP